MLWTVVTAVSRFLTLDKLYNSPKFQAVLRPALAWYKLRPRKIQLAVVAALALTLLLVLFG
jgi:hypothetical protein